MKEFSEIAQPGAYLVDFLPIRRFIFSSWSPTVSYDVRSQVPSGLVPGRWLQEKSQGVQKDARRRGRATNRARKGGAGKSALAGRDRRLTMPG